VPWHERDTRRLVERLDVPVYTPLPDTAEFLMSALERALSLWRPPA
jgi:hypothetical protein